MKLKTLAVVEEATIDDLEQGDILTFANGEQDVVVSVGEIDMFGHIPIEFESKQTFWFYPDFRHMAANGKNVVRIERWIEVPYNLFDEGQAQIDCGVIIAKLFDQEEGGLLAKPTGEDQ